MRIPQIIAGVAVALYLVTFAVLATISFADLLPGLVYPFLTLLMAFPVIAIGINWDGAPPFPWFAEACLVAGVVVNAIFIYLIVKWTVWLIGRGLHGFRGQPDPDPT